MVSADLCLLLKWFNNNDLEASDFYLYFGHPVFSIMQLTN